MRLQDYVFHAFYFILAYYIYNRSFHSMGYFHYPEPKVAQTIISWIPTEYFPSLIPFIGFVLLTLTLFLGFYPWFRIIRIIQFIFHLFFFAYLSSFGHQATDYYVITFMLPFLIFIKFPHSKEGKELNSLILNLCQLGAVMSYGMAGLWKIKAFFEHGLEKIMMNLGNVIAFEHFQRGHEMVALSEFFVENDWVTGPMYIMTIGVQAFSPLGAVYSRKSKIFTGVILCVFHILSEVIVHINFRPQMAVVILLLIFLPLVRIYEEGSQKESS